MSSALRPPFANYAPLLLGLIALGLARPAASQVVEGRLVESGTDRPIMLGAVALTDTTFTVVDRIFTDHLGRFTLEAPEPGAYLVVADALGYRPSADGILDMAHGGFVEITFYLPRRPIEVEGVEVTIEGVQVRRDLVLTGFYDRMKASGGHFITPEELASRPPTDPRDLFRRIPAVRVVESLGGQTVLCNGRDPVLWVDGARVGFLDVQATDGLDLVMEEVANVDHIAAVEVYTGPASTPAQFTVTSPWEAGSSTPACTIAIWTHR